MVNSGAQVRSSVRSEPVHPQIKTLDPAHLASLCISQLPLAHRNLTKMVSLRLHEHFQRQDVRGLNALFCV